MNEGVLIMGDVEVREVVREVEEKDGVIIMGDVATDDEVCDAVDARDGAVENVRGKGYSFRPASRAMALPFSFPRD